jgi:hypothetical protein
MFKENFKDFFNSAELAESASIGGIESVDGIFDHQFVEVMGIESVRPVFTCAESDLESVAHGNILTLNSIDYKVAGIQPDGTGLTSLILEKQ